MTINNGKKEKHSKMQSQNSIEPSHQVEVCNKQTKELNKIYPIYKLLGFQNKLKRYNYFSFKEKAKLDETGMQYNSKEISNS
ncbi:1445_t:CDS:1, partial [Dentiscutata heterogama]